MRRYFAAAVTAAVALGITACGGASTTSNSSTSGANGDASVGAGKRGGTLTLAPIAAPLPWDLKDAGLGNNAQYYQPVYDSLMRLDAKGEPTPNVATKWSYDAPLTTLTLTIRSGLKFTDGATLDASAVKANLDNTKTGANEAAGMLKGIKSVKVVDPTTVTIRLSAPDPSFAANLGNVAGMLESPKAIGTKGIKTTPVGSGPYKMDPSATTAGSQYTFVRNPTYWNAKAFPFDKVVLKPLNDPTAVMNALRSGQINGALLTNAKNIAPAKSAGLTVATITPGDVDGVYIWDREGKTVPALGKLQVRQALNYAFDKNAIVKTAKAGLGQPTTQVFNPTTAAYDTTLNQKYTYDPAKAKQMLAAAGYPKGFDVTVPDLSFVFPDAQAAMEQELKDIGVRVKVDKVPPNQLINALLGAKYPISYFSLASFRPWDTIVIQGKKDSLWNPFHTGDQKSAALIKQAQTSTGTEQDQAVKDLNTYMVDQAWNAPWTTVQNAYATTKGITFTPYSFAPVPPIYNFRQAT